MMGKVSDRVKFIGLGLGIAAVAVALALGAFDPVGRTLAQSECITDTVQVEQFTPNDQLPAEVQRAWESKHAAGKPGEEFPAPTDLEGWKKSLYPLWVFEGDIGTLVRDWKPDGTPVLTGTTVKAGLDEGGKPSVVVMTNDTNIADICIYAQLMLGQMDVGPERVDFTFDAVDAACGQ